MSGAGGGRVAILAGGGAVPSLLAGAAAARGIAPLVVAIAGEADPADFGPNPVHILRWGEIGRLLRLLEDSGCASVVFAGSILRRPDFGALRPDLGALRLMPRILALLRGGDDSLLRGVAAIFEERGIRLASPLDIAPDLALPEGPVVGRPPRGAAADIAKAAEAARLLGSLDIGQGAVAVGGRVVATEDAGGTDALLERVAALRRDGRIGGAGGILVKCMKPNQDARLDLPTIGPKTAERAAAAGLKGVAGEAGRALVAGPAETAEAFRRKGLFLYGLGEAAGG